MSRQIARRTLSVKHDEKSGLMAAVEVAAGIILDPLTGRVLVARRNTHDIHLGKWEFPGGKIIPGESVEIALKRELSEELGIRVLSVEPFESMRFDYSGRTVNLNFCLVTDFSGHASGLEGQMISWVELSDLPQLDMLEANHLVIDKLLFNRQIRHQS